MGGQNGKTAKRRNISAVGMSIEDEATMTGRLGAEDNVAWMRDNKNWVLVSVGIWGSAETKLPSQTDARDIGRQLGQGQLGQEVEAPRPLSTRRLGSDTMALLGRRNYTKGKAQAGTSCHMGLRQGL